MKKKFFPAVLLFSVIAFLSSCGGHSAEYANEVIVEKADKVIELMDKAFDYIDDDEYDNAQAYLDSVINHVTTSEPIIAALNNKSAEKLQQATLEYLTLFKAGVADYKQAIEIYKTAEDDEQMEKANDLINNFIEKADAKLSEMQELQIAFAKENNIILED